MPITINGSGTVTGISAGGLPDDCIVTADIAAGAVTQAKRSEQLTLDTAKTATGTSVDFTGIPSWAKRVTVMFNGVSTNSTSSVQVQLGDSGGFETTGYASTAAAINTAGMGSAAYYTSGCVLRATHTAAMVYSGRMVFSLLSGNTFTHSGQFIVDAGASGSIVMGSKSLSGTLDRLRITTVNGTDTFDAGSINILYK